MSDLTTRTGLALAEGLESLATGDARTAVARFTEATWLDAQRRIGRAMAGVFDGLASRPLRLLTEDELRAEARVESERYRRDLFARYAAERARTQEIAAGAEAVVGWLIARSRRAR